jgi:cell division septum initiation protein DivIVA
MVEPTPQATPSDDDRPASGAAAHLLEMTARDADRWLSEAQSEAASLLDEARAEADQLLRDARAEAEQVTTSARDTAADVVASAEADAQRVRAEVAELQRLATESRESLRRHLTGLLDQVNESSPDDD